MEIKITIPPEYIGMRIDTAISDLSENISRSQIQKLIKNGEVLLNGLVINDCSRKILNISDVIIKSMPDDIESYEIIPENIPLKILYEDEYIVIIDKLVGMVCHPAPGHKSGTLVNALMYHFNSTLSDVGGKFRPGIVHRLDKDTSGVMLVAKTNDAHRAFADMFANEKGNLIKRRYTCFVFGVPFLKQGRIETGIIRHPKNRQTYTTSLTAGKKSITLYNVVKSQYFTSTKSISEIDCELLTGRTHQIRVHMKHLGHHIIGDQIYGKVKIEECYPDEIRNLKTQALHSRELVFIHPLLKREMRFEAQSSSFFTAPSVQCNL